MKSIRRNIGHRTRITVGSLRAFLFVLLVGISIAFWFWTESIIDHVRDFQKEMIGTQKDIYMDVINPDSDGTGTINSELIEKSVFESTFPSIITDENNVPLQGLWRNVGIAADDTTEESRRKLMRMVEQMDRINPPDSFSIKALIPEVDTLYVYDLPPDERLSLAITDQVGKLLYKRNVPEQHTDAIELLELIYRLDPNPIRFSRENKPSLIFYGMSGHGGWPVVVTGSDGTPLYWQNVGVSLSDTSRTARRELSRLVRSLKRTGFSSRIITHHVTGYTTRLFHYGDPQFVTWIAWLPVIEFGVILLLIAIGFIGFSNITQAEKQSIWVGMAKETAHQLGTPISSIDGWVELLKTEREKELVDQAVGEIAVDVDRLTRVAARFSSIGSYPELQPLDVSGVIDVVLDYFKARVPNMGRRVILEQHSEKLASVRGNHELLNWAFENLIKNALASIENSMGKIVITGRMSKDFKHVILDISDNGKGIAPSEQKKIMKPGYTTKKRGWGLGLSLVKRIFEDYHDGKFLLLESRLGVGTVFRVILPAIPLKETN